MFKKHTNLKQLKNNKNKNRKNNTNRNKGITLIALVVTIIILLILAGVTISLVLGDSGIVVKARQSKVASRYGTITDKVYARNAELEVTSKIGGTVEDTDIFIENLKKAKLIVEGEDYYNEDEGIIYLGKQSDNNYLYEVEITEVSSANPPDLRGFNKDTTYYVTWDTSSSPYEINENTKISQSAPSGWSNYSKSKKQWANIKTTGGGNACYWVWIPRYAYKVPTENKNVAEIIDIKFLPETSNTPVGGTAITNTTPAVGSWVVHPAFTNAGNGGFGELRGIWVAKYEASSDTVDDIKLEGTTMSGDVASLNSDGGGAYTTSKQIRVKPNVTSWREINVNDIFTVCRNMTDPKANNTNSSLVGTTGIDSHMIKNTEWGAVAYLSMSKYGKNDRVWNNSYYNNKTYYSPITGLAGNHEYTPVTSTKTMHPYNTTGGRNASTTGNVYGVYDMVGGAGEYTAGYLSEISPETCYRELAEAEDKYKDKYAGTSSDRNENYAANSDKYGDAIYETSSSGYSYTGSWYGTGSYFPSSSYPIIGRSGHANDGSYAGVFAFGEGDGYGSMNSSFRPALVVGQ